MATSLVEKRTLIDELDSRQDEVLAQLDELNVRIESVIQEWLTDRTDEAEEPNAVARQSGGAISA